MTVMINEIQEDLNELKNEIVRIKSIFEEWAIENHENKTNYSNLSIWELIDIINKNPIQNPFLFEQQQKLILLLTKMADLEHKIKILEYQENINAEFENLNNNNNN